MNALNSIERSTLSSTWPRSYLNFAAAPEVPEVMTSSGPVQVARLARQLPTGSIQMVQLGPSPPIKTDDLDADDLT